MVCPKCGGPVYVQNTIKAVKDNDIYRIRICKECKHRFTTIEYQVESTLDLIEKLKTCYPDRYQYYRNKENKNGE